MATLATIYDWPECQPKEQAWLPLAAEERSQLSGTFVLVHEDERYETQIAYQDQGLSIQCPIMPFPSPFYCIEREGDSRVFINSSGAKVQFTLSEKAEAVVTIFGNAFTREKESVL